MKASQQCLNVLTGAVASALMFIFCACSHSPVPQLDAVFWHQKAPEYPAATINLYAHARLRLDQALEDRSWSAVIEQINDPRPLPQKTAIILDIDETVLNNSPLYARKTLDSKYNMVDGWKTWTDQAQAEALEGAVEFVNYAAAKGVRVFFVSNRTCDQDEPTRKNLTEMGFFENNVYLLSRNTQYSDPEAVIKCPRMETFVEKHFDIRNPKWTLAKSRRRKAIAGKYRVLLQFGDSQGDFYSPLPLKGDSLIKQKRLLLAHLTPKERFAIHKRWNHLFKDRWMVLPNAMYGNWQSSYLNYENLSQKQAVGRMLPMLDTKQSP